MLFQKRRIDLSVRRNQPRKGVDEPSTGGVPTPLAGTTSPFAPTSVDGTSSLGRYSPLACIRPRFGHLWAARGLFPAALIVFWVLPILGQGYAHGTSETVITSSDEIVAAIDSKEVDREYLSDGTSVVENRAACRG